MFCTKCGTNNPDGYAFCAKCGAPLGEAQNAFADQTQPIQQFNGNNSFQPQTNEFVEPDEVIVADLRNGYLMNLIGGETLKKEKAYITNKRFYYRNVIKLSNTTEDIVDLEDITGTKITRFNPIALLIFAGLILLLGIILSFKIGSAGFVTSLIFAAIFVAAFFITRKSFLAIEYAGGKIFFSVKGYSLQNIRTFQKAIYHYKELLKNSKK